MRKVDYTKLALKTESIEAYDLTFGRLVGLENRRLLHATMGLSTEAAELLDVVKKHLFYGKPFDKSKLVDEAGDVCWYLALLSDVVGVPIKEIMDKNIAKLKARYGDKFTSEKAINRDEQAEAKAMLTEKSEPDTTDSTQPSNQQSLTH